MAKGKTQRRGSSETLRAVGEMASSKEPMFHQVTSTCDEKGVTLTFTFYRMQPVIYEDLTAAILAAIKDLEPQIEGLVSAHLKNSAKTAAAAAIDELFDTIKMISPREKEGTVSGAK